MDGLLDMWRAHRNFIGKPRLAQAVFHVIGAEHGHGKSTLTAALIKVITTVDMLPNGTEPGITGKVFLGETECRLARLLRTLSRWGVPFDLLDFPGTPSGSIELTNPDSSGWRELEKALANPAVVAAFIDTMTGAPGNRENDPAVKEIALRLGRMATENSKPIVGTHHLNQLPAGVPPRTSIVSSDFRGHGGIVDSPPILVGLLKPEKDSETPLLIDVKNGETDDTEPDMAFRIDVAMDGTFDADWPRPERKTKRTIGERCSVDMKALLENSSRPVREVQAALLEKRHSRYAIRNAQELLGVEAYQDGLKKKGRSARRWRVPS